MFGTLPMTKLDDLKARMLADFEAGTKPDIAAYVREAPEARETLLDYWVVLLSSTPLAELGLREGRAEPQLDTNERKVLRDLCLAASLGPEWLKRADADTARQLASIGAEWSVYDVARTPSKERPRPRFGGLPCMAGSLGFFPAMPVVVFLGCESKRQPIFSRPACDLVSSGSTPSIGMGHTIPRSPIAMQSLDVSRKATSSKVADQLLRPGPKHSQATEVCGSLCPPGERGTGTNQRAPEIRRERTGDVDNRSRGVRPV